MFYTISGSAVDTDKNLSGTGTRGRICPSALDRPYDVNDADDNCADDARTIFDIVSRSVGAARSSGSLNARGPALYNFPGRRTLRAGQVEVYTFTPACVHSRVILFK